ncbi:MAG: S1/P1 nuclease, partial [Paraglaciecola chathamensis]
DPKVWIAESIKIRNEIYPEEKSISWDYLYNHLPQAQERLKMAGIRIATYLNDIYK